MVFCRTNSWIKNPSKEVDRKVRKISSDLNSKLTLLFFSLKVRPTFSGSKTRLATLQMPIAYSSPIKVETRKILDFVTGRA